MFKIMTFSPKGHSSQIDNKIYTTREEAEKRLNELKEIYNATIYIKEENKMAGLCMLGIMGIGITLVFGFFHLIGFTPEYIANNED